MDAILRNFFNDFHQALGFDIPEKRDQQIQKVEQAVFLHAMGGLVKHLAPQDKKAYDQMMIGRPDAKTISAFFKPHLNDILLEDCFEAASREVTGRYVKTMLEFATREQKVAVQAIIEKFFKNLAVGQEAQVKQMLESALAQVNSYPQ